MVPLQTVATGIFYAVALGAFALLLGAMLYIYYWIYRDATTNSSQSAAAWVAFSILFPVVGVVLYFLVGRDRAGHGHGVGPDR
jgi:cell shape-determining protein MreD